MDDFEKMNLEKKLRKQFEEDITKQRKRIRLILLLVCCCIGIVFIITGIALFLNKDSSEEFGQSGDLIPFLTIGIVFCSVGLAFFILGVLLYLFIPKTADYDKYKALINDPRYYYVSAYYRKYFIDEKTEYQNERIKELEDKIRKLEEEKHD